MARIPVRLAGPALVPNSATTVYTVPGSTTTVVRNIHVQNPTGSAVAFSLSIGTDAAGTRVLDAYSIPAAAPGVVGSVVDFWAYYVLTAAEIIEATAGTNNVITLTIDGDEIT